MTETTARIRWKSEPEVSSAACAGYAGAFGRDLFRIYAPDESDDRWVLASLLPGSDHRSAYGESAEELKPIAERLLSGFVSSLGAIFPAEPDCSAVTRFEVIDHTTDSRQQSVRYSPDIARSVVARNARVAASFQDDGRTLKVFLADPETTAVTAAREKE